MVKVVYMRTTYPELAFIGISDHTYVIPGGLKVDKIQEYVNDIKLVPRIIKVYAGCEIDILLDGNPVFTVDDIKPFDYVILSIHHAIGTNMVDRYIKAIELYGNKHMIIAHPTGRSFGKREIPEDDWGKLFNITAERHVLLEINVQPLRLDLPVKLVKFAKALGNKFIINTDSHGSLSYEERRDYYEEGLYIARAAGLGRGDLIMDIHDVELWLMRK
jgi:DNA polymerase (family 10)